LSHASFPSIMQDSPTRLLSHRNPAEPLPEDYEICDRFPVCRPLLSLRLRPRRMRNDTRE
jgi:hypothetical protein